MFKTTPYHKSEKMSEQEVLSEFFYKPDRIKLHNRHKSCVCPSTSTSYPDQVEPCVS